ncbi:MAG: alpha/beta hydrolase [Halieaceae bacterium]|jgi:acetyl esterase/lipase|nr:alpha/beta hydrolase [Halieaceae bacterium]
MKVTREMLHEDLRPSYRVAMLFPKLLQYRGFVRFLNWLGRTFGRMKQFDGFDGKAHSVPTSDGSASMRVLVYRPKNTEGKLPALLYLHGGGYIMGNPEQAAEIIESYLKARPCVVIAPDYRKSYTRPFPAGFEDCYDALLWAKANAESLGIESDRFMVAGHSAGGGLAAAVTLKARDTGDVDIAFQMPIYPMIDDTQPDDAARDIESPIWDTRMNRIGWGAYLAGLRAAGEPIPAYAAPFRCEDCAGLPPTITFVGTLEPFYQETGAYVQALRNAGVEVVYEEFEGCYHAFDFIGGKAGISARARAFTFDNFGRFYDQYVNKPPVGADIATA